ncbi:uncharacterized protein C8R40DRAFT_1071930 [Lentinula edodes]|uniref:uncharacterized protein n=1 Tax=Lentinula edodes TaxID=5353 RepID=UPI001E8CA19F|nr:uncharacterized protein C8R40DRAFT_1071930 [Lentinula edodes]KAH7872149.1 hypothetical protein C8R40DRAFT_1071930 [Lentinula edodes]
MHRMFLPHAAKLNIQFDTLCGQGLLQGLKPGHSKSESCLLPPKAGAHPPKLSQAMRVLANAELSEKVVKVEDYGFGKQLDRSSKGRGRLPAPACPSSPLLTLLSPPDPPLPSSPSLNSSEHVSTVLQQVNSSPIGATGSNRLPSIIRCYIHSFHSASAFSGTCLMPGFLALILNAGFLYLVSLKFQLSGVHKPGIIPNSTINNLGGF